MDNYIINADCTSREEAINLLVDLHYRLGNIESKDEFKNEVIKRESALSTFAGNGIAIPHGRGASVKVPSLTALTLKEDIPWGENRVNTVFLLASPDEEAAHMKSLSNLAKTIYDMLY